MLRLRLPLMLSLFKSIWLKSWTKFWGYCQMAGAAILGVLGQLHSYISDPTLKSYLGDLDLPKYIISGLAVFGIVTWLAHGRADD